MAKYNIMETENEIAQNAVSRLRTTFSTTLCLKKVSTFKIV